MLHARILLDDEARKRCFVPPRKGEELRLRVGVDEALPEGVPDGGITMELRVRRRSPGKPASGGRPARYLKRTEPAATGAQPQRVEPRVIIIGERSEGISCELQSDS